MPTKPTLLFVPGAWHKSACYTPLIHTLQSQGYETATAELPSVGADPGLKTWDEDISSISHALTLLASSGKSIILIAHSYGSLPAGEALKPFLLSARTAEGKPGGVVHIVYISAFVLPPATSLMDALNGTDLPWFRVSASKTHVDPIDPATVFYNDISAEQQEQQINALETFSYNMFFQKTTWAPYKEVGCSYVFCTSDNAIPLQVQRGMVDGAGVTFRETVVEAGHSPFLSRVEETARAIVEAAESV